MKTLAMLTNVDKARILFDLFTEEIPDILEYTGYMANKVKTEEEDLKANWNNPFLSCHQWCSLAEQAKAIITKKNKALQKSGKVFAEQLFCGYTAIFTNHCIEQFARHRSLSVRFKQAVALFYVPLPQEQEATDEKG